MKHAFIFDMDGVLVDSNPAHTVALRQFCKQHGYELSESQLREKIYGRTNRDWIKNLFGNIPDDTINRYAQEKEALFRDLYHDIKPLDGLLDFLKKMNDLKIPRAIATSAPRANVDFTVSRTGIGPYFSTILDDSFVTVGKPHPEIYLKSAAALDIDPSMCIVFEDSLSGVMAGKAAGCKVVGITTTHTPEELHKADLTLPNFLNVDPKYLIDKIF